jgi:hypothetical protein
MTLAAGTESSKVDLQAPSSGVIAINIAPIPINTLQLCLLVFSDLHAWRAGPNFAT